MTQLNANMWKNSDIVDNTHITLLDAFTNRARLANKEICIATGYLYLSGLLEVIDSIHKDATLRIIMGDETDRETADELEIDYNERCKRVLSRDLDSITKNNERLEALRCLLNDGRLQVRIYKKSKFHAKAYIFARNHSDDDKAIVGSSNLTRPGLDSNTELNVVHKGTSDMHLLKSWFNERWDEAKPFNRSLLRLIDESGKRPGVRHDFASAHKLLQEVASEIIRTYGSVVSTPPRGEDPLAQFQIDGAAMLEASIARFRGAILSDSVGLGKTFTGMRVIQNYLDTNPSSRVLLIAPRGAIPNWRSLIHSRKFGIDRNRIIIQSTTELSNYDVEEEADDAELALMSKCGLVVIDEAHRFRNKERKNRRNLDRIGTRGKKVLLITATAVNNSATDLKSIIEIFTDGTVLLNHDRNMDIGSFTAYAKHQRVPELDHKKLEQIKRQMMSILQAVMVQRTRLHVEGQVVNGKRLKFSNPTVHTRQSDGLGHEFFIAFEELLSGLELPHMHIAYDRVTHVGALYRLMLYKRLESSMAALDMSLRRLVRSQRLLLDAINSTDPNGAIERWWKESRRTGIDDGNLDDLDDEFAGMSGDNITQKIRNMDNTILFKLREDLDRDIATIEAFVRNHITKRRIGKDLYLDPKADALKSVMDPLSGHKVLIFTQSADTAYWLDNVLRNAGHKSYGVVTGKTDDNARQDLIDRFSPRSSNRQDLENTRKELSILIATDTLAEAVNLQDCSNIVNFDLPWNPMILVQRVGRVDRIGNVAPTHVHNIMPSGTLEHFLNLISKLKVKLDSVTDTVGKEFQILSDHEVVNPKKFEQQIRKHPAYTGNVSDAVSVAEEHKGRVTDDMALPALELLRRHNLEMLRDAPSDPVCSALRMPTSQHTVVAMYRIYDITTNEPLSNIVVSMTIDNISSSKPEISDVNSGTWLTMFDFMGHGDSTHLDSPSNKSRELLGRITKWFIEGPFATQRDGYHREGRKPSNIEFALTSRIHEDAETLHVLESAAFGNILKKITNIEKSDILCEWIETRTDEEIQKVSKEVAYKLQKTPGFVLTRRSGDIGHKLICWCAREPI